MADYVTLNNKNWESEVLGSDKPVLVDFWAPWCGPCRQIAPHIEALATEYKDKAVVGKLNIDESQAVAAQHGVQSIPTLLLFKGGKLVDRHVGFSGNVRARLKGMIDDNL
ncbi:MAG: thioredoxin [Bradymonadia bacterium]